LTIPEPLYRLSPLTQGQWAVVDAADYEWLMQWKWNARWLPKRRIHYAMRNSKRDETGKQRSIAMHREILALRAGDKRQGDHINHNTLDNRRCNLRIATHIESSRNRRTRADNTSGYKGVFLNKNGQCYARITVNKKPIILEWFPDTSEGRLAASEVYRQAAKKHFGEFFCER
jgi:hypothetical protein